MKNQCLETLLEAQLELVEVAPSKTTLEANDARLRELEREMDAAAQCGSSGLAGYDDRALTERWIRCPAYGQN